MAGQELEQSDWSKSVDAFLNRAENPFGGMNLWGKDYSAMRHSGLLLDSVFMSPGGRMVVFPMPSQPQSLDLPGILDKKFGQITNKAREVAARPFEWVKAKLEYEKSVKATYNLFAVDALAKLSDHALFSNSPITQKLADAAVDDLVYDTSLAQRRRSYAEKGLTILEASREAGRDVDKLASKRQRSLESLTDDLHRELQVLLYGSQYDIPNGTPIFRDNVADLSKDITRKYAQLLVARYGAGIQTYIGNRNTPTKNVEGFIIVDEPRLRMGLKRTVRANQKQIAESMQEDLGAGGSPTQSREQRTIAVTAEILEGQLMLDRARKGDKDVKAKLEEIAQASWVDQVSFDHGQPKERGRAKDKLGPLLAAAAFDLANGLYSFRLPARQAREYGRFLAQNWDPTKPDGQLRWLYASAALASTGLVGALMLEKSGGENIGAALDNLTTGLNGHTGFSGNIDFARTYADYMVRAGLGAEAILSHHPQDLTGIIFPSQDRPISQLTDKASFRDAAKIYAKLLPALLSSACTNLMNTPPPVDPVQLTPPVGSGVRPTEQPTPTPLLLVAVMTNKGVVVPVTPDLNKIYTDYADKINRDLEQYAKTSPQANKDLLRTYHMPAFPRLYVDDADHSIILGEDILFIDYNAGNLNDPNVVRQLQGVFTDIGNMQIRINFPDKSAPLYFWSSNLGKHIKIEMPNGEISDIVFDLQNNRLLFRYKNISGQQATTYAELTGTNAGKLAPEAAITTPTRANSPTASPSNTPAPTNTAQATVAPTELPTSVPKIPELRVDGPYIRNAETGNPINFSGVSIFLSDDGRYSQGMSIDEYVKFNVEANQRLGLKMNMVRLAFYSKDLTDKDISDFLKTADYLASKGILMVITPTNDIRSKQNDNYYLPNQLDKDISVKLASVLKDKANIIYGIWNEPSNTDWNNWSSIMRDIYNRISQQFQGSSKKPLFFVSGINWSRDFRGSNIPIPLGSYLIDVHKYPILADDQKSRIQMDDGFQSMIGNVPIIISESGDVYQKGGGGSQTSLDLEQVKAALDYQRKYSGQIGVLVWRGEQSGDTGEGIRNKQGRLTQRGQLLQQFQNDVPPTDLIKK